MQGIQGIEIRATEEGARRFYSNCHPMHPLYPCYAVYRCTEKSATVGSARRA